MLKMYLNRRSITTFLVLFLSIFAIAGSTAIWSHRRQDVYSREEYARNAQQETERVESYFKSDLDAGIKSCYSIFTSRWYTHYRNIAGIYADEFDGMRKIELMDELNARINTLALVYDVLIITPPLNTIICKNGWFTYERYRQIYGIVNATSPDGFTNPPHIELINGSYCLITLQDSVKRRDKGVICLLISKKDFAASLSRILPDSANYIRAELGEQLLYQAGAPADDAVTCETYAPTSGFRLTIGYPSYDAAEGREKRMLLWLLLAGLLLASAMLAICITTALLKPLSDLIIRFGGKPRDLDNPYRFIHQYVDAFASQRAQLSHANSEMQRERERFLSLMRNEILYGMLTNPNFNLNSSYAQTLMPWLNDRLPFVLVLLEGKYQSAMSASGGADSDAFKPGDLVPEATHSCCCTLEGGACVIAWFDDDADAEMALPGLSKRISALGIYYFEVSGILREPHEFSREYHALEAAIEARRHGGLDLSISTQIKLISKIRAGRPDECVALISSEVGATSPDAFLWLLMRIAAESGFDMAPVIQTYGAESAVKGNPWRVITDCARSMALAEAKSSLTAEDGTTDDTTAQKLVRYINANFCDSELCVNALSDMFSMHRTLVSKAVKSETGATFTDYLTDLRMKRALELMSASSLPIVTIAVQVGFSSYTTFKRAFMREYGVSPSEYRKANPDSVDMPSSEQVDSDS